MITNLTNQPREQLISFDFDDTLSSVLGKPNKSMVKLAKKLAKHNTIIILTSRSQSTCSEKEINLFIKKHKLKVDDIVFTNGMYKATIVKKLNIFKHYDDDAEEIQHINSLCSCGVLIDPDKNIKKDFKKYYGIPWL